MLQLFEQTYCYLKLFCYLCGQNLANQTSKSNSKVSGMKNPYISQVLPIKEEVKKRLPYGFETTAGLLLEFMIFEECLNDNI